MVCGHLSSGEVAEFEADHPMLIAVIEGLNAIEVIERCLRPPPSTTWGWGIRIETEVEDLVATLTTSEARYLVGPISRAIARVEALVVAEALGTEFYALSPEEIQRAAERILAASGRNQEGQDG